MHSQTENRQRCLKFGRKTKISRASTPDGGQLSVGLPWFEVGRVFWPTHPKFIVRTLKLLSTITQAMWSALKKSGITGSSQPIFFTMKNRDGSLCIIRPALLAQLIVVKNLRKNWYTESKSVESPARFMRMQHGYPAHKKRDFPPVHNFARENGF